LYKFTSPVYKTTQLARQVGDSRALSIVEKEAMAPHTARGLAGGMTRDDDIHRQNYGFIGIKGQRSHSPSATIQTFTLEIWVPIEGSYHPS
jgi:hypothetical protein